MKKIHPLQKRVASYLKIMLCVLLGFGAVVQLKANDIIVIGLAADDPDQISFVTTTAIPAGTVIYFTDNEWTGTGFNTGEGNISYTAPTGGIAAGTVVTITNNAGTYSSSNGGTVVAAGGSLALSTAGDQIYAYYGTNATTPTEVLSVLSNVALLPAEDPAGDALAPNVVVTQYVTTLDNIQYNGPRTDVTYSDLVNPANWIGADVLPFTMNTASFTFFCATISNLTTSLSTACSGSTVQVCVTADLANAPSASVEFSDGTTILVGSTATPPPIPRTYTVTANPTNPYTMPTGPIYVGDIVSLPGLAAHPLSTTSVPAGAATISGATTTQYYVITVAGTYGIICDIHSTMTGSFTASERPNTSTQVCANYTPTNTNCAAATIDYTASVQNCSGTPLSGASVVVYPNLSLSASGDGACGTINAVAVPASCTDITYSTTFTQGGTSSTASGSSFTPSAGQIGTVTFTLNGTAGAPAGCATATSSAVAFNCSLSPVCPTTVSIAGAPATACQGSSATMTATVDQGILGTDYTIQWEESINSGAFVSVGSANGGQALTYTPVLTWTSGCSGETHDYRAVLTPIGACAGSAITSNTNTTSVFPALSITAAGDGACGAITATALPTTCGTVTYSVTYTTGTGTTSGTGDTFTPTIGTAGNVVFTLTNSGAPTACASAVSTSVAFSCTDPCVGFSAPDALSAISVCEGGSTTITPSGGGNGGGAGTPIPFTYTWDFEGGITGAGVSSDATVSGNAAAVVGGPGITLLVQAAGSGCTAAVSSNGYTGATGVPGTQADAIANGDYFEFCIGAPQTGYTLAVTGLAWNHRASSTITNYAIYAATDLVTALASGSGVTTSCSSATATFAANSAICYRIYYWGATSATSTLRIDNMVINATATPASSVSYNYYTTDPAGGGQTPVATGATYTPTVAAGSSVTYYVTADNGTCESTAVSVTVSVTSAPNAGADGVSAVCNATAEGTTTIDLATLVSGANGAGTFAPVGSAPALTGTTFDGNGLTPGIYSYNYTVTAVAPCTGSDLAVFAITVNDCVGAVCSLSIGTISVSACSYSAGQSTSTVSVPLVWANAPSGENITVNIQDGTSQTITSPASSGTQTLTFVVPADGVSGKTISAAFSTTSACSDSDVYDAPAACDPCVGFSAPDALSAISVCEGGSTTITPSGGGNGGGAGTPIPFTYTWDFEGGITGAGVSSDATVSGNAAAVAGGPGITLLVQAAGSGCTAAVSSNGYTGATGVQGTQADALANGDYFEFCIGAPQTGYTLAVTGLAWNHRASSTITNYAIYAATDLVTALASGSGVTTSCSGATATFSANSATCYRIYYWGATSASSTLRIDNMVINATATPVSSVSYNYYTADPAGGGQTPVATGFAYTPTVAAGSSITYYVTADNGTCESTAVPVTVSVTAAPNAGADGASAVCNATAEGTTTIDLATLVSGANGAGTFAPVGSAPALTGTTFDGNGLTPGIYSYNYTVTAVAPCTGSDLAVLSINVNDCVVDCTTFAAPTVTTPLSVCEGGTITIAPSGGGSGGATPQAVNLTWDFENAADLSGLSDNSAYVGNPLAATNGAGIAALAQAPALTGGCSAAIVTSGFNGTAGTNGQSNALTSGDYVEFCVGAVQTGYAFNVMGMTWNNRISGTGPANYAVYAANNLTTPLATGSITTAVGVNACETEATSFSSTASCFRIYLWGATSTGGTFRIDNMVISGQAIPAGAASYNFYDANPVPGPATLLAANVFSYSPTIPAGTSATYYVTADNGTCESVAVSVTASVVAAPQAGLDGAVSVCNDSAEGTAVVDLATLLSGADAGGVFAAVGSAPALTGSTLDATGVAPGAYQYSYTVLPTAPCILADVALFTITVQDCVTDACAGFAPPLVSGVVDCQSSTSINITPTGGGAIPITDLFISEYVEGSGNTKCLEIYNGTGSPVMLDGVYSVKLYSNGNPLGSTPIALTGTIASGDVFVICNTGAAAGFLAVADQTSGNITFNGNDAVALLKNGVEIDIFGNIGCDPGTAWTAGTNSTLDQTLVRASYVATGISTDPANTICDFPTLGTQWVSLGLNGLSNLGLHISTAGTVAIPPTSYNIYADNGGVQGALISNITAGSSYSPTGLPAGNTTYWVSAVSSTPSCESVAIPVNVFLYGPITATISEGDCNNTIASISQDNAAYTSAYVVNYTTGTGPAFGPGFAFDYSALVPGVAGVATFTVQYSAAPVGCNLATFDVPFNCTTFPCSLSATAVPTACSGATYDLNINVVPNNQLYTQFIVEDANTQYGPFDYTASPITITGLTGDGATGVPITITDYAGWVVNEVLYDPPLTGGDANGDGVFVSAEEDFVELLNLTGSTQDISGFTLLKNAVVIHTFPAGTLIPNGCGIVVFGGGTPTGSFGGMTVQTSSVGATTFNLSANGTHVVALQNGTSVIASATYTASPSDDASATRNPDVTGALVLHNTINGTRYSPGTQVDGTSFAGCSSTYNNCSVTVTYDAPLCTVVCASLSGQDVTSSAICSGEAVSYTVGSVTGGSGTVTWVYSTTAGFNAYGTLAVPFTGTLPANIGCTPITYYLKARLDGSAGCTVVSSEFSVDVYPQINYTVTAQGGCTASIQLVCPGFMVHYISPATGQVVMGNSYTAAAGTSGTITFDIMQTGAPSGCDMAAVNVSYNCPGVCPVLDNTQAVSSASICSGSPVAYTVGGVTGGSGTVTWVYSTTAGFDAYGTGAIAFTGTLPANTNCTASTYYVKARLDGATGCTDVSAEFSVTVYPNITFTTSPGGCTASITASCPGFNVAYTDPATSATVNGNSYTATAGTSGNVIFTITNTAAPLGFSCRTASTSVAYNCAGLVCSTLTGQAVGSTSICSGASVNYTMGSVVNNSYTGGTVTWVYGTTAGFNAYGTGAIAFTGTLPANTGCTAMTYYLKARLDNVAACQYVSQEFVVIVYPAVSGTLLGQGSCTVSVVPNCPNFTVSYVNPTTGVVVNGSSYTGATCTQGSVIFTITNPAAPTGIACASTSITGNYSCIDATCSGCPLPVTTSLNVQENGGVTPFDYNTYVITVSGGTLPYNFNWNNSGYVRYDIQYTANGATITIVATDASIYNVTITDQNGCYSIINDDQNSSIGVPTLDIVNYAITGASSTNNGSINITVGGGGCTAGQYTYLWSNGATTEDISGLASGWYSVTVTCPLTGQTTAGWYWVPKVRRGRTKTNDNIPAATIAAMPNPFSQVSRLEFSVAESGHTQISVFDMSGREVAVLFDNNAEAGRLYGVPFEANNLPAGIYTAQLISDNGAVESIKLVLTK